MPSSLIFASLVVVWLLILVPAVARRRQEVARPSVAALSGRVLDRASAPQRRRTEEVVEVQDGDEGRARGGAVDIDERVDERVDERDGHDGHDAEHVDRRDARDRPRVHYRPGRGGFDPDAAAMAARARYTFRQRVVLLLLVAAVASAVVAVAVVPGLWWPHGAVDAVLVGYLVYLRRQVRMEEAIRERRAARMAGTRRARPAPPEPATDDRVRTEEHTRPLSVLVEEDDEPAPAPPVIPPQAAAEPAPALPRLKPAPPPPLPPGTRLVEDDDEDPALHDLDAPGRRDYRRAAGQ